MSIASAQRKCRLVQGNLAISTNQKRGWELFKGKAKCIECHSFSAAFPFFTDYSFNNTGITGNGLSFEQLRELAGQFTVKPQGQNSGSLVAHAQGFTELGRYLVTKESKDIGAFKTPTRYVLLKRLFLR